MKVCISKQNTKNSINTSELLLFIDLTNFNVTIFRN